MVPAKATAFVLLVLCMGLTEGKLGRARLSHTTVCLFGAPLDHLLTTTLFCPLSIVQLASFVKPTVVVYVVPSRAQRPWQLPQEALLSPKLKRLPSPSVTA